MSDEAKTALTIAGFDPSSGAGVTADVLTFAAHGIFATAAITAVTVQSTLGVFAVEQIAPAVMQQTLLRLEKDLPPAGVKIGMLATAAHAAIVAEYLEEARKRRPLQVVLDPVIRSSSGSLLLDGEDGAATLQRLLRVVDAVTPNLTEAAALTGLPCTTRMQIEACAGRMRIDAPHLNVVVTGGHRTDCADLVSNTEGLHWLEGKRIQSTNTHGTGCAFSSALLAERLLGRTWLQAAGVAKTFVARGIERAVSRGAGNGPLALLPQLEKTGK